MPTFTNSNSDLLQDYTLPEVWLKQWNAYFGSVKP
jgi:hypothetical protein